MHNQVSLSSLEFPWLTSINQEMHACNDLNTNNLTLKYKNLFSYVSQNPTGQAVHPASTRQSAARHSRFHKHRLTPERTEMRGTSQFEQQFTIYKSLMKPFTTMGL